MSAAAGSSNCRRRSARPSSRPVAPQAGILASEVEAVQFLLGVRRRHLIAEDGLRWLNSSTTGPPISPSDMYHRGGNRSGYSGSVTSGSRYGTSFVRRMRSPIWTKKNHHSAQASDAVQENPPQLRLSHPCTVPSCDLSSPGSAGRSASRPTGSVGAQAANRHLE